MSDRIRKAFDADITRAAGGDRVRRFVISTDGVDRDNDTISVAGWALDNYRKNPVVLWAHDYSQLPLGKALQVGVENNKLVATAEFADHPMADTVLRLLDGGFLRATSVGFRPIRQVRNTERGGTDYLQQELLEFSVVPVPANADALRRALKVMEADTREADDDVVFEPEDLAAAIADVLGDVVRVEIGRVLTVARGRIDDFDALADPAARHRHGEFDVDDGEVRALVAAALRDRAALGAVIGEATRSTLDRLRGRVD